MKCMMRACNNESLPGLVYDEWAWCGEHYEVWRQGVDIRKSSDKTKVEMAKPEEKP